MRYVLFNDSQHFLFHNSKSESRSLKAHTFLHQLIIDAQSTEKINPEGKLVADSVHSVHHT